MSVSRIDILNQAFSRCFRGYTPKEVDRYMQDAADTIGNLSQEKTALETRVAELEIRLAEYRQREEMLRDTLVTTQRVTDELKATAQREAQLILDAAHQKAESMINQGHQRLAKVQEEILAARKLRARFELRVQSVLDEFQKYLEMIRKHDEKAEAAEEKVTYLAVNKK